MSKNYLNSIVLLVLLCSAFVLMVAPVSAATTVIIPTNGDTVISQRSPSASGDGLDTMMVRTLATRNTNYRSAVHFDLSSIPQGATISSATLHLYISDIASADGVTFYNNDVHRITGGDWNANVLTWDNCPAFEPVPTDSKPTGSVKDVWSVWDVTPDIQAYTSGAPMYGWVIKYPVESLTLQNIVYYNTLEYLDPARCPYLEVTYSEGGVPAPEFPTMAFPIMVIGIVGLLAVIFRKIG